MQTCHTLSTVYQIYAFVGNDCEGNTVHQGGTHIYTGVCVLKFLLKKRGE